MPSKKEKRILSVAKRVALQGTYGGIKHGAVLTRGGSIINVACNKSNFCSFGTRFRKSGEGTATLHAELACILNLDRSVTSGASIYVVRVDKNDEFKMSRPCSMCEDALRHVGIRKVNYTNVDGDLESYKL